MNDKSYNNHMHRVGRVFMAMGLSVMLMVPVLIWVISGVGPDWNKMIIAILSMSILYLPSGIIEVVTYSPFLGTGATYLAFVTGNLVNLKIPCVMNAREIAKNRDRNPRKRSGGDTFSRLFHHHHRDHPLGRHIVSPTDPSIFGSGSHATRIQLGCQRSFRCIGVQIFPAQSQTRHRTDCVFPCSRSLRTEVRLR